MKKKPVMLCAYNFEFVEVYAKGGICQGDSLFPFVFVSRLIPVSLVLRKVKAPYYFSESKENINN